LEALTLDIGPSLSPRVKLDDNPMLTLLDPNNKLVAPIDPNENLAVTVRLRPQSEIPGDYVGGSRNDFENAHAATDTDITNIKTFAGDFGLTVDSVDATSRSVVLSGNAAQMESAFDVGLSNFQRGGQVFHAETSALSVPSGIAPSIVGVFGLNDQATSTSQARIADPKAAHSAGYTPLDVAKAYHFPSGDGAGEHIAVISLGGRYDDTTQAQYLKSVGVAHVPFNVVNVDGGADDSRADGPTGENTLDAEVIGSLVPNADKTMYIAPNTDRGFLDAIATALHDKHHNTAISISWGSAEQHYAPQDIRAFNELFKEAKAMGVNVFCAAGDNGSSDGIHDGNAYVDFPSSSPSVIANGGTKLLTDANGGIAKETVWNELAQGAGATGGGISTLNPKPPTQSGLPIRGRGVPDIAGNADPVTGYRVLVPPGEGNSKPAFEIIGGTSAVAPLYAALAARLEENLGKPLGDFQKAIYDAPASAFNDITSGNNGEYHAGPGWDAVTGRGSVDGTALLHALTG
jgi:kumamolisin